MEHLLKNRNTNRRNRNRHSLSDSTSETECTFSVNSLNRSLTCLMIETIMKKVPLFKGSKYNILLRLIRILQYSINRVS